MVLGLLGGTAVAQDGEARLDDAGLMARLAAEDVQRPVFHAAPPVFTMGDPNGLIQVGGVYHLFYQHARTLGPEPRMHWGHSRSRDLVRWESLPVALTPEAYYHIASGSAVDNGGEITAIYTGAEPQQQCLAMATDPDLVHWRQYEGNPVIAGPPDGLAVTGFRDPCVWREGDRWLMAVGSGVRHIGGVILLYGSPDLRAWTYLGPLCTGNNRETGDMWECPSFFELGGRYVLVFNALPLPVDPSRMKAMYMVGAYEDGVFTRESLADLDLFGEVWAPQVFTDERGRRVLLAMAWEQRDARPHGWSGCMTFPREVWADRKGRVGFRPVEELQSLRVDGGAGGPFSAEGPFVPAPEPCLGGDGLEVRAVFRPEPTGGFAAERFGLVVRRSPGGEEETRVYYDTHERRVGIDRSRSSLDASAASGERLDRGAFASGEGEPLALHVIIDRSVVDVFVNDRAAGTTRIYPTRADSVDVGVFADRGTVRVESIETWRLAP